jgi:hypothetical protein
VKSFHKIKILIRRWWHTLGQRKENGKFKASLAGRQWLKPVILATQEAEIRRITA